MGRLEEFDRAAERTRKELAASEVAPLFLTGYYLVFLDQVYEIFFYFRFAYTLF